MNKYLDVKPEVAEAIARSGKEVPQFVNDITVFSLICSGIVGVIMWSILHSTFVRPFILVGVLRNFINSGKDEKITEGDFRTLEEKSPKFKKLHTEA